MVPACSSGTLINVLPHSNAMLQTQYMTHILSMCYPLMCNIILEYSTTRLKVFGQT